MRKQRKDFKKKDMEEVKHPYQDIQNSAYYRMKNRFEIEGQENVSKSNREKKKFFGKKQTKESLQSQKDYWSEETNFYKINQSKTKRVVSKNALNKKAEEMKLTKRGITNKKTKKEKIEKDSLFPKATKSKAGIVERQSKKRFQMPNNWKLTGVMLSLLAVLTVMSILLINRYSQIAKVKYDINGLNKELLEVQNQKDKLNVQMETSNRSDIIEKYAREQLGMDYPKEDKITYIKVN